MFHCKDGDFLESVWDTCRPTNLINSAWILNKAKTIKRGVKFLWGYRYSHRLLNRSVSIKLGKLRDLCHNFLEYTNKTQGHNLRTNSALANISAKLFNDLPPSNHNSAMIKITGVSYDHLLYPIWSLKTLARPYLLGAQHLLVLVALNRTQNWVK